MSYENNKQQKKKNDTLLSVKQDFLWLGFNKTNSYARNSFVLNAELVQLLELNAIVSKLSCSQWQSYMLILTRYNVSTMFTILV